MKQVTVFVVNTRKGETLYLSDTDPFGVPLQLKGYQINSEGKFSYFEPYALKSGIGIKMPIEESRRLLRIGEDLKRNSLNDNEREALQNEASQIYRRYVSE